MSCDCACPTTIRLRVYREFYGITKRRAAELGHTGDESRTPGSVVPGRMEARAISDALKGLGFVNTGGASRVSVVIACVTGGWSVFRSGEVSFTPVGKPGTRLGQCEAWGSERQGYAAMLERVG